MSVQNQPQSTPKTVEITRPDGSTDHFELAVLSRLGAGRAAEVHLVRDGRTGEVFAEKAFKSAEGLSQIGKELLYRLCFQAPSPYGSKESALKAALFRRKVLRDLTEFWFDTPLIADACYTRFDETSKSYTLGTEFIQGRGPKPGPLNARVFRQGWHNYPVRLARKILRSPFRKEIAPQWEIEEASQQLEQFKEKFHQAGFIGSEWQVNKALSVPTSNLRRNAAGQWMLIDVESAFPALVFPRDIWRGLLSGNLPLFDDTDFDTLKAYLQTHSEALEAKLGPARTQTLHHHTTQLELYTKAWKNSEPAIFRNKHRLITNSQLRANIRFAMVEYWYKKGQISTQKAGQLKDSPWRFYGYLVSDLASEISGIPFAIGRSIKKLGRGIISLASSAGHLFHAAFLDEPRLREMAESNTNQMIDDWQDTGRLTPEEANALRQELESPTTTEYLKGLVVHIGFQALEPPFVGDAVLVALAIWLGSPEVLAGIFISPLLRTSYTLYRKIKHRGTGMSYRYALLIGALPKVGILAYPAQMASTQPGLSSFLARYQASRIGAHLPLFGGIDSRLEHLCMRAIDLPASLGTEFVKMAAAIHSGLRRQR